MGLFKKKEIYKDDPYQGYHNYGVNTIDLGEEKDTKAKVIMNIIFIVLIACMIMITVDTIAVANYQVGPFFAIRTRVYNDGGTSEYHGLGYKVIKYNQTDGRKDIELGTWNMPYSVKQASISALDLAIELRNTPKETYSNIAGKVLKITGDVSKVDKNNNKIFIEYTDPAGEYTLEIIAKIDIEEQNVGKIKKGQSTTILGTVTEYKEKTENSSNQLYITNGFIK